MAWGIAGWLFFFFCFGGFLYYHGERWECGRYWMPRLIVAENGYTYTDGTPIDPINMALMRADCQEEFELVLLGILAGLLVGAGCVTWFWHPAPPRKPVGLQFTKGGRWN